MEIRCPYCWSLAGLTQLRKSTFSQAVCGWRITEGGMVEPCEYGSTETRRPDTDAVSFVCVDCLDELDAVDLRDGAIMALMVAFGHGVASKEEAVIALERHQLVYGLALMDGRPTRLAEACTIERHELEHIRVLPRACWIEGL